MSRPRRKTPTRPCYGLSSKRARRLKPFSIKWTWVASHLIAGTFHEKAMRGKKISVLSWEHYPHMQKYEEEVVKAFGFPRADK